MELDIWYYLIMGWYDKICDRIKYLKSQKVVLQIVSTIILEKSELIHIIHTLHIEKIYFL